MSDGSGEPTGPKRLRRSDLFFQVRTRQVIDAAWQAIKRNSRVSRSLDTRNEVAAFEENVSTNLHRISRQLQQNKFVFAPARGVRIPKDKKNSSNFRPLVVAKVESRIVQRAIHDVLILVPEIQKFVRTPHSFGGVKKDDSDHIAAVPAAIHAVLEAIGSGSRFAVRSDITKFFTRVPKSTVSAIVARSVNNPRFLDLFEKAIAVELENMAQLREHATAFPIEDIGVAQGNSLSPLLGNLYLYDFDLQMNTAADVRCIRYIDDFIILARTKELAENMFFKAKSLLKKLGLEPSPDKTQRAAVEEGFEFLGIELANGLIRPSRKSQTRILGSIESALHESKDAFREHRKTCDLPKAYSLLDSLWKIRGILQGWGKHYRFCNDVTCFDNLDRKISQLIKAYLGIYSEERNKTNEQGRWRLLGIESLAQMEREAFCWPKKTFKSAAGSSIK
ncbi:MAG TPA: reverse transcriptase domain-containing protein [Candidatus Angelobacter sp.]|nr:reverse transcriptase domain-containing protein [Candidatus Angelobacter sp.]